jgi:SAM-dependent methyltransferase
VKLIKKQIRRLLQRFFIGFYRLLHARKLIPICSNFGWSRGTPVGRYYVDRYVSEHAAQLGGSVLEFGDKRYSDCFGSPVKHHVIDVVPGPAVDFVCDIHDVSALPQRYFDVIVCTQVLEHVARPVNALRQMAKLLKPGGALICTVPLLSQVHYVPTDFQRFTADGLRLALEDAGFIVSDLRNAGNAAVSIGSLLGMVAEDFSQQELAETDGIYPFNVLAFARLPG